MRIHVAIDTAQTAVTRHFLVEAVAEHLPMADLPEFVADFLVPAPPRRAKRQREETD